MSIQLKVSVSVCVCGWLSLCLPVHVLYGFANNPGGEPACVRLSCFLCVFVHMCLYTPAG